MGDKDIVETASVATASEARDKCSEAELTINVDICENVSDECSEVKPTIKEVDVCEKIGKETPDENACDEASDGNAWGETKLVASSKENTVEVIHELDTGSVLDKTIASVCKVCGYQATITKKRVGRNVLSCHECNELVHFQCTRLPPYMLHSLSTSSKRYVCESCSSTPENFLQNLICDDIKEIVNNTHTNTTVSSEREENDRLLQLEGKIDSLSDAIEKYDITRVADSIQATYTNINKINSEFKENIGVLVKSRKVLEKFVASNQIITPDSELKTKVDEQANEIKALKATEILLLESVNEKDKLITSLSNNKEKHVKNINELHTTNQSLCSQLDRFLDMENSKVTAENKFTKSNEEVNRLNAVISNLKSSCLSRENELDLQVHSLQKQIQTKQVIINHLTETYNTLQTCVAEAIKQRDNAPPPPPPAPGPAPVAPVVEAPSSNARDSPKVILFHDSLCRQINESMMNRENVTVTKIWAPTLGETKENVDEIDRADRIVVQALTREVGDMETVEFTSLVYETVEKCLTKAEKVVVSLIVPREDDVKIRIKAEAANAHIKLKYMNHPNVVVCHHDNLRDRRYRKQDKLHLTDPGTSRLANNLKFKIAESLGIEITRKARKEDNNRYDRSDRYERPQNQNQRFWNSNNNGSNVYRERYQPYQHNVTNEHNDSYHQNANNHFGNG